MSTSTVWARARSYVLTHRRRFAGLSLVVFLAAVLLEVGGAVPRDVEVALPMGAHHALIREARIEYTIEGESVRTVTHRFERGAPREMRDSLSLSPGDYEVSVLLIDREGAARESAGRFTAPSEGVVRLALEDR